MFAYRDMGPVDKDSVGFRVTGLTVGVVSLHLSAVDGHGRAISSSHKNMQVYPPFKLQPRKLTLAVGSVRQVGMTGQQTICWFQQKHIFYYKHIFDVQVKWEGGPHPRYGIKFSVSDSFVAVVTETGLVRGVAVGVVKIRGTLQTQNTEALLTFLQVTHIVYL